MTENDKTSNIFAPTSLYKLLTLLDIHKDSALLFAGGIDIMLNHKQILPQKTIINLENVEELSRITRTEKYIEIGASATISRLLSIGHNVIPSLLYDALINTSAPSIRNLITIGGNLCSGSYYSTVVPALVALDAMIEIRSQLQSNWVPVTRFLQEKKNSVLRQGEVVTRIRVPYGNWMFHHYKKISPKKTASKATLIFCGAAQTMKNVLSDLHLVYGALDSKIYHNRELESAIIGRKFPFSEKELSGFGHEIRRELLKIEPDTASGRYKAETSARLTTWFLNELSSSG